MDVRTGCEVVAIDRQAKQVHVRRALTGELEIFPYDKLMLAPGAMPIRPQLPGMDDPRIFTLHTLQNMDAILAATNEGTRAVVIGAGFIGLEMTEQLHRKGLSVHLVEQ